MDATEVVLSHPADLSRWGRLQLESPPFQAWLRRVHDDARPGDRWTEFLDAGCCGDTLDVTLRVERVDGDPMVGPETRIRYVERGACGIGGWRVQSRVPPGQDDDG